MIVLPANPKSTFLGKGAAGAGLGLGGVEVSLLVHVWLFQPTFELLEQQDTSERERKYF